MVIAGWETIDTAPRDGSDFIAFLGNGYITRGRFNRGKHFSADSMGPQGPRLRLDPAPTHWMPLPPKPKTGAKNAAD